MKTKTIIFLIRKLDSIMTELIKFNTKSDNELDKLVRMYDKTFEILKIIVRSNWMTTNVKELKQELNCFQLNVYAILENKMVRKYYNENYWLN